MAPHSSTLAWKIPWTEDPGRLKSIRSGGVRHGWATSLSLFTFTRWRRKWQPTPVFLPGESQGRGGGPGGLPSTGSHRVRHDWSDLAAAAAVDTEEDHSSGNFAYGIKWWWRRGTSEAWVYQSITASLILALAKMYFLRSYSQELHFNIQRWFWC